MNVPGTETLKYPSIYLLHYRTALGTERKTLNWAEDAAMAEEKIRIYLFDTLSRDPKPCEVISVTHIKTGTILEYVHFPVDVELRLTGFNPNERKVLVLDKAKLIEKLQGLDDL